VYRDFSGIEGRDSCLFLLAATNKKQTDANDLCIAAYSHGSTSAHLPTVKSNSNTYQELNTATTHGNIQSQIVKLVSADTGDRTKIWAGAAQPTNDAASRW
jgi:hypothetical protein